MDQLIPVINRLQEVVGAVEGSSKIDLPQIVVVGSQSSGKSSVLENLVGRDFLPRGSGIVTRRPLILQLRNVPKASSASGERDEWGEFKHKPNEYYWDFGKIREEIIRETDRLTGKNKGISSEPIILKISSPSVLNLTLVDLPGITRVPVGDQPLDIEDQIRRMVLEHIQNQNAIILAVTAANTDLANSDALQLAKIADPEGQRTIGVLTKLDLMDKGTDAMDILQGQVYPLRLGFIGVVSRSQQDIISDKPIQQALQQEVKFFQSHPLYKKIAHKSGTAYLAQTLNKVLMAHIRQCLPTLKAQVASLLQQRQQELLQYGGDPVLAGNRGAFLLQTLTKFSTDYVASIDGKLSDVPQGELYGGARINWLFSEHFAERLAKINPLDGLSPNDIRTAIRNATGPRTALFVPEAAFELLVKRQISKLVEPCGQCVDLVFDELQRIIQQLADSGRGQLARFAPLRERVAEVATSLLSQRRLPTKAMIDNLLKVEMAYINAAHPNFIGLDSAMAQLVDRVSDEKAQQQLQQLQQQQMQQAAIQQHQQMQLQGQIPGAGPMSASFTTTGSQPNRSTSPTAVAGSSGPRTSASSSSRPTSASSAPVPGPSQASASGQRSSASAAAAAANNPMAAFVPVATKPQLPTTQAEKERHETELIRSLLESYFTIVRTNLQDQVPKAIMHFLVNKTKLDMQHELVAGLYKEDLFDDLLAESPDIAAKRKSLTQTVEMLTRANGVLNDVRDGVTAGTSSLRYN